MNGGVSSVITKPNQGTSDDQATRNAAQENPAKKRKLLVSSQPIQDHHVVLGDQQSRDDRTTAATKLLRKIKAEFKAKYKGSKREKWIPDAIQTLKTRLQETLSPCPDYDNCHEFAVLIKCTAGRAKEVHQANTYGYDSDRKPSFGVAVDPNEALTKFFHTRDAPNLSDELQRYQRELKAMTENLYETTNSSNHHEPSKEMLNRMARRLSFFQNLLDEANQGDAIAKLMLDKLSPVNPLKHVWKEFLECHNSMKPASKMAPASVTDDDCRSERARSSLSESSMQDCSGSCISCTCSPSQQRVNTLPRRPRPQTDAEPPSTFILRNPKPKTQCKKRKQPPLELPTADTSAAARLLELSHDDSNFSSRNRKIDPLVEAPEEDTWAVSRSCNFASVDFSPPCLLQTDIMASTRPAKLFVNSPYQEQKSCNFTSRETKPPCLLQADDLLSYQTMTTPYEESNTASPAKEESLSRAILGSVDNFPEDPLYFSPQQASGGDSCSEMPRLQIHETDPFIWDGESVHSCDLPEESVYFAPQRASCESTTHEMPRLQGQETLDDQTITDIFDRLVRPSNVSIESTNQDSDKTGQQHEDDLENSSLLDTKPAAAEARLQSAVTGQRCTSILAKDGSSQLSFSCTQDNMTRYKQPAGSPSGALSLKSPSPSPPLSTSDSTHYPGFVMDNVSLPRMPPVGQAATASPSPPILPGAYSISGPCPSHPLDRQDDATLRSRHSNSFQRGLDGESLHSVDLSGTDTNIETSVDSELIEALAFAFSDESNDNNHMPGAPPLMISTMPKPIKQHVLLQDIPVAYAIEEPGVIIVRAELALAQEDVQRRCQCLLALWPLGPLARMLHRRLRSIRRLRRRWRSKSNIAEELSSHTKPLVNEQSLSVSLSESLVHAHQILEGEEMPQNVTLATSLHWPILQAIALPQEHEMELELPSTRVVLGEKKQTCGQSINGKVNTPSGLHGDPITSSFTSADSDTLTTLTGQTTNEGSSLSGDSSIESDDDETTRALLIPDYVQIENVDMEISSEIDDDDTTTNNNDNTSANAHPPLVAIVERASNMIDSLAFVTQAELAEPELVEAQLVEVEDDSFDAASRVRRQRRFRRRLTLWPNRRR